MCHQSHKITHKEMAIWWQSEKPKENYPRKKPLRGKFFSIKQIHYSKRNLTIIRKPFPRLYWPIDNLQKKPFTTHEHLNSSTTHIASTDDAHATTTRTSNRQDPPGDLYSPIALGWKLYGFNRCPTLILVILVYGTINLSRVFNESGRKTLGIFRSSFSWLCGILTLFLIRITKLCLYMYRVWV